MQSASRVVWRNGWRVSVDMPSLRGIRIIYVYLSKGLPWEQPIGHVVERDPAFDLTTDSSEEGVGVCVPLLRSSALFLGGPVETSHSSSEAPRQTPN
jgi:hypothetical protein